MCACARPLPRGLTMCLQPTAISSPRQENLAALSGLMKDFFDRCYYPVLGRINGRPYGLMICAGSDGTNAARQAMRIATGWRLRAVAEPLIICTHAQTPEAILAPKVIAVKRSRKMPGARRHLGCGACHGRVLRASRGRTPNQDNGRSILGPVHVACRGAERLSERTCRSIVGIPLLYFRSVHLDGVLLWPCALCFLPGSLDCIASLSRRRCFRSPRRL